MYGFMQAIWRDGTPYTLGDWGYGFSNVRTHFVYPGDPTTSAFWSESNADGEGTPHEPGYRYFNTTTGPFDMMPGDTTDITFAIAWSRGTSNLDSVRRLKADVRHLKEHTTSFLSPIEIAAPPPQPEPRYELGFAPNYPNPFSNATTIRYSLPQQMQVRLAVYDVLGREVAVLVDQAQEAGIYAVGFEAGGLPPGVYLYRIALDHLHFTKTMTLVR
jgi:hypothetical protein